MGKTEVYSWRLTPELKAELERAAKAEQRSLAGLLERISRDWLRESHTSSLSDAQRQEQLHRAAASWIGAIEGDDPERASQASQRVREKLRARYGR